jgi:hypothetical protein
MIAARVAGAPLVKYSPKCKAQQAIDGLARTICGKPSSPSSMEMKTKLGRLFGRR